MAWLVDGAVTLTETVADFPGARSVGRAKRWSLNQLFQGNPGPEAKCRPSRMGLLPPAGQVWLPVLVTVTGKVCVC